MLDTSHLLQQAGIKLRPLTEQLDTVTATGRLMFNFLGTIAEYFLDFNRERTMEGLKAASARGRKGRRPKKLAEADVAVAVGKAILDAGTFTIAEIAKRLGIDRRTFYEYFPRARARIHARRE